MRTLGERFAVDETAFKPYPSCRYSHAAIDLIREIIAEAKLKPEDVSAVRIGLPRKGMDLIGVPEAAKRTPRSIVDGQFSMFFLAAVALLHPPSASDACSPTRSPASHRHRYQGSS